MIQQHCSISRTTSRSLRCAWGCRFAAHACFFLLVFSLGSQNQTQAEPDDNHLSSGKVPTGWKTYHGNFFEIGVPPNFVSMPENKRRGGGSGDEVALWNQDQQVEFYVYSPQWNGVASRTVTQSTETLDSHESKTTGGLVEERWVMSAKDKSYVRFVVSFTDTKLNTNKTFGIRVPSMRTYAQVKPTFIQWKRTLQQFAD